MNFMVNFELFRDVFLFDVRMIIVDGQLVRDVQGCSIESDGVFSGFDIFGVIIVSGMQLDEYRFFVDRVVVLNVVEWLKVKYLKGSCIVLVCVGSFVLGEVGLFNGWVCIIMWWLYFIFVECYLLVKFVWGKILVEQDNVVIVGGLFLWVDLVIYLVCKYVGNELVKLIVDMVVVDSQFLLQ